MCAPEGNEITVAECADLTSEQAGDTASPALERTNGDSINKAVRSLGLAAWESLVDQNLTKSTSDVDANTVDIEAVPLVDMGSYQSNAVLLIPRVEGWARQQWSLLVMRTLRVDALKMKQMCDEYRDSDSTRFTTPR
eukprot:713185-Karenia_brevis.AAC.1